MLGRVALDFGQENADGKQGWCRARTGAGRAENVSRPSIMFPCYSSCNNFNIKDLYTVAKGGNMSVSYALLPGSRNSDR